jgi:hypothetical protein
MGVAFINTKIKVFTAILITANISTGQFLP